MTHRFFHPRCMLLTALLVLLSYGDVALAQKKNLYACKEPDPASLCTAANTCGSPSQPCTVNVKRTANAASATPGIPDAKGNQLFCVKVDTSVTWHSDTKHQGFVVDMGPTSPFTPPRRHHWWLTERCDGTSKSTRLLPLLSWSMCFWSDLWNVRERHVRACHREIKSHKRSARFAGILGPGRWRGIFFRTCAAQMLSRRIGYREVPDAEARCLSVSLSSSSTLFAACLIPINNVHQLPRVFAELKLKLTLLIDDQLRSRI